jgi:Protein of unknown function (DUF1350)
MQERNLLNYEKIANSQVLLHPQPKGIIQFIGSFIFGSFPALAYKPLHEFLFDRGYSLILYKFPLNPTQFNHWEVALDLIKEQHALKVEIIKALRSKQQSTDLINLYLQPENYLWLGHSLGCKYIALLEILSDDPQKRSQVLQKCLGEQNAKRIIDSLDLIGSVQTNAAANIQQLLPEIKPSSQSDCLTQVSQKQAERRKE